VRSALTTLVLACLAAGCGGAAQAPADAAPGPEAAPGADAAPADGPPGAEAGPPDAAPDAGPLTCVRQPATPATACWHSLGGRYAHGACSASYQCCSGAFVSGTGSCGACTCTEPTGTVGCVGPADGAEVCFPAFAGRREPLPADVRTRMTGSSWHAGCPVSLDDLALLHLTYLGLDGGAHEGEMVVAASVADTVLAVFQRLYEARFPLAKVRLVDDYGASDDASMADDNTAAFNCRAITGGTSFSQHSYGNAIDLNPVENPYVKGGTVLPPAGAAYLDRTSGAPGMIVDPGPATGAFRAHGWGWGGSWSSLKDYQHFSANGL
jgi:hypothetical protein